MRNKFSVFCTSALVLALAAGAAFAAVPSGDLLFSVTRDQLPESGVITNWGPLVAMDQPTVEVVGGQKWVNNEQRRAMIWDPAQSKDVPHDDRWAFDGFRLNGPGSDYGWAPGNHIDPIAINGASIVVSMMPLRPATVAEHSDPWSSLVDIFYDRLVLGIRNDNGQVVVRRNGQHVNAAIEYAIPEGQATILSLVVQNDGAYKVWANGVQIMDVAGDGPFTALTPGSDWFKQFINVGRNQPDGWSTFNGLIGDVFVYKNALSDDDRMMLESHLAGSPVPEPGSILAIMSGLVGLAGYGIRRRK